MPNTIVGIIIALFAILPGLPGYAIYSKVAGSDWRLKDWENAVRVMGFSVAGFVLYSIIADLVHLTPPIYVLPSTYTTANLTFKAISDISKSLVGHAISSALIGGIFAYLAHRLSKLFPTYVYVSSWEIFINNRIPYRWVVVGLSAGQVYAGMIDTADASVSKDERDIILSEPAEYQPSSGNYRSLPYQSIFLPAKLISSIAIVHDPVLDKRVTLPGSFIFPKGGSNGG